MLCALLAHSSCSVSGSHFCQCAGGGLSCAAAHSGLHRSGLPVQIGECWGQGTVTALLAKGTPLGIELVPAGASLWLSTFQEPWSAFPSLLRQLCPGRSWGRWD